LQSSRGPQGNTTRSPDSKGGIDYAGGTSSGYQGDGRVEDAEPAGDVGHGSVTVNHRYASSSSGGGDNPARSVGFKDIAKIPVIDFRLQAPENGTGRFIVRTVCGGPECGFRISGIDSPFYNRHLNTPFDILGCTLIPNIW